MNAALMARCPLEVQEFFLGFRRALLFYEEHAPEIESGKWEYRLQLLFLLSWICVTLLGDYMVIHQIPLPGWWSALKIFIFLGLFITLGSYGLRGTWAVIRAASLLFRGTTPAGGTLGLFGAAMATVWKIWKPVVTACGACVMGGIAVNEVFSTTYGFAPSREIMLARHGLQSWDEARTHILHPEQYRQSAESPQLQDLKRSLAAAEAAYAQLDQEKAVLLEELQRKSSRRED